MGLTGSTAPASARLALREATASLHLEVESRFAGLDLATANGYGRFLLVHAEVIPALEAALDRAGIEATLPDWPRRRRAAALATDLTALGLPVPAPRPAEVRPGAEALGVTYVLEGSRLGATMLLKAIPPALPRAFLAHGAGEHLFRSFLPHLDAVDDVATAVVGARLAFGLFLADPA